MRKVIIVLILISIALYFPFKKNVDDFVKKNFLYNYIKYDSNSYFVDFDYGDFNYHRDIIVYNRGDVIDVFYTFINRGTEDFSFYCDSSYFGCKQDVINLIDEKYELLFINDFVHPFNAFDSIKLEIEGNKIHINIDKNYSYKETELISSRIKEIIDEVINDSMDTKEKITFLHNYIILNVEYDEKYAYDIKHDIPNDSSSYKASGALFDGMAVCSGYADLMALFLSALDIQNIKVSTNTHVWNAVNIDGKWLHIDVTNDDIENNISYQYLLLDSDNIRLDHFHDYSKIIYSFF